MYYIVCLLYEVESTPSLTCCMYPLLSDQTFLPLTLTATATTNPCRTASTPQHTNLASESSTRHQQTQRIFHAINNKCAATLDPFVVCGPVDMVPVCSRKKKNVRGVHRPNDRPTSFGARYSWLQAGALLRSANPLGALSSASDNWVQPSAAAAADAKPGHIHTSTAV